jgi:hypothetical protein
MERAEPAFKQPAVGAPAWRRSVCGKGQPSCGGQQLPLLSLAAGAWWVKMRESREGLGGEQAGGAGLCLRAAAAGLVGVAEQRQCCLLRGQPPAAVGAAKQGGEGGQQPQTTDAGFAAPPPCRRGASGQYGVAPARRCRQRWWAWRLWGLALFSIGFVLCFHMMCNGSSTQISSCSSRREGGAGLQVVAL